MNGAFLALGATGAFALVGLVARSGSPARIPSRAALLRTPITSHADAKAYLDGMILRKFDYHLDSPANDIVVSRTGKRLFSKAEAKLADVRRDEVFSYFEGDPFEVLLAAPFEQID